MLLLWCLWIRRSLTFFTWRVGAETTKELNHVGTLRSISVIKRVRGIISPHRIKQAIQARH